MGNLANPRKSCKEELHICAEVVKTHTGKLPDKIPIVITDKVLGLYASFHC